MLGNTFSDLSSSDTRKIRNNTIAVGLLSTMAENSGTVKFILQTGSLHPGLAKLAFGFRPIVIGYLHLVLLGLITIFILAFLKRMGLVAAGGLRKRGIIIFISGIVLQEALLLLQGGAGYCLHQRALFNEALFASALIMLAGIGVLNLGMRGKS